MEYNVYIVYPAEYETAAAVREDHLHRRYLPCPSRRLPLLGVVKHLQQVVRRVKHLKAVRVHLSLRRGQDRTG